MEVVQYFSVISLGMGLPQPDLDQLMHWVKGEETAMPLSEEEKIRIREIEMIRAEAQQEALRQYRGLFGGPVVGNCQGCGKSLQMNWRYCPFCGAPSSGSCPRCHFPLPEEEGVQFCPQCGGRV